MSPFSGSYPPISKHDANHRVRDHEDALELPRWYVVLPRWSTYQLLGCVIVLLVELENSSVAVNCGF